MTPPTDDLQRIQVTRSLSLMQRRRGHRTATDDVLCAWGGLDAAPRARRLLDLGAGHGSVTLMLAGALPQATGVAVEIQAVSYELLVTNLVLNGLDARVAAVHGDLRDPDLLAAAPGPFDLVTGSPPFMPVGSGPLPKDPQRAGGRFELRGGVEEYAAAIARWLAPEGVGVLLMDGASRPRCERALARARLALRAAVTVHPRAGKAPRYLLYVLGHGGRPDRPARPARPAERRLVIRDQAGRWTPQMARIRAALELPGGHG